MTGLAEDVTWVLSGKEHTGEMAVCSVSADVRSQAATQRYAGVLYQLSTTLRGTALTLLVFLGNLRSLDLVVPRLAQRRFP